MNGDGSMGGRWAPDIFLYEFIPLRQTQLEDTHSEPFAQLKEIKNISKTLTLFLTAQIQHFPSKLCQSIWYFQ